MPNYTITGRVVYPDGSSVSGATVQVYERTGLGADTQKGNLATTAPSGAFTAIWTEGTVRAAPWEVYVEVTKDSTTVRSSLIYDLEDTIDIHVILGDENYRGLSEWERVQAKVDAHITGTTPENIPADRLEWLSRRADVFPTHLAYYIQAHRLAYGRTIQARSCYAFLRAGLSADLPKLLRAGEAAWTRALRAAWDRRILPLPGSTQQDLDNEIATEIAAMRELLILAATTEPTAGGVTLWSVLETAGVTDRLHKEEFMTEWVNRESLAGFWDAVTTSQDLGPKLADIQFALQATTLTRKHLPLLSELQALYGTSINSVGDLAAWSYQNWDDFLVNQSVAAPDDIPGADATERRQNYARGLQRIVEDSYPTLSLRHRIAADEAGAGGPANTDELVQFFDDNAGFDVARTNISKWVVDNPSAFANATDPAVARSQLERAQRVYRLTPRIGRYDATKVLLDNGIGSAADVVARTREEFVDEFSGLFGTDHHDAVHLAGRVWDNASKIHGVTMGMASVYALGKSKVDPNALAGVGSYDLSSPELADLDGVLENLDYCACEHCRSVFSPAAYLADLLAYLSERPSMVANETALDELSAVNRRPDLVEILLDCDNTNTPLPYIDLVNESLEARFTGTLTAQNAKQTTWPASELLLHPEHLDTDIYTGVTPSGNITTMVYPWVLPFSLSELEAQRYLEQVDLPLHELIVRLQDPAAPLPDSWTAAALELTELQREIVAGESQTYTTADYWGYPGALDDTWATPGLANDVGDLLARADIELDDLIELLDLTFIDPGNYGELSIYINFDESCQLADAQIVNLSVAALDRLHRFIRLQRATSIPQRMLNVLIEDVGGGLDGTFLTGLVHIRSLHERLGTPWDELATWWAPRVDARNRSNDTPLYHRTFLSAAYGTADFADFATVEDSYTVLAGEDDPEPSLIDGHIRVILAASRLTRAEFDAIALAGLAGSTFTFANLTAYYRVGSFARANKLSVTDLIALIDLTGINPFTSPADAHEFVETLETIRDSRFSLRELDWVLRHPTQLEHEFRADERVGASLGRLALELARIDADVAELIDPQGIELEANLASILSQADVIEAMAILTKTSSLNAVDQVTFVDDNFASFTDTTIASDKLVTGGVSGGGSISDIAERFNWLQREFVRTKRREALVVDRLAQLAGIQRQACRTLLFDVLTDPSSPDPQNPEPLHRAFNAAFATQAEVDAELKRTSHSSLFLAYDRLDSAARVVRSLALPADQIAWYSGNSEWIDLDALPLTDVDADIAFANWTTLRKALALRELFPSDVNGLRLMTEASTLAAALDVLAVHSGWDVSETTGVGYIANALSWTPSNFNDGQALTWLRGIVDASEQIGATVAQLWDWTHTSLDSAEIKQAIRTKYDDAKWREVAQPLRDRIRVEQREALIAAILATDGAASTREQLSDQLLIDLDMAPCMMTSRIKQAISTVQTFINRSLLGLESNLSFGSAAAERWEWMKNYRVWEANRKVFLYPENWIEPSLRRDKTPLFKKLESSVLQAELDEENLTGTVMQYIEQLDEVAKLEIVSTYDTSPSFAPDSGEMWVLGRTQDTPHRYWVRVRTQGQWQAWEEVTLPISSDNVALVVRGSHTYLFWLTRDDASSPTSVSGTESSEGPNDFDFDRITVAWSERRRDGWSDPRMSDSVMMQRFSSANAEDGTIPPNKYLLKTVNTTPMVELRAYVANSGANLSLDFQRFLFNPSTKQVRSAIAGSTPDAGNELSILQVYAIDGQRYVADTAFGFQEQAVETEEYVINGTTFNQGGYSVELFRQRQRKYRRAFVHQSDQWLSLGSKKNTPAFFDDNEHKYLIRVEPIGDNAADEGGAVAPSSPGSINTDSFWGMEAGDDLAPSVNDDPFTKIQLIKDEVAPYQPWNNQAPGIKSKLFQYHGQNLELDFFPNGDTQQMLNDLGDTVAANDDVLELFPSLKPESDAVRLRLMNFHHPFASKLISELNLRGIWGLYGTTQPTLLRQLAYSEPLAPSKLDVNVDVVKKPIPIDEFEFEPAGAYSTYNWEVFFHIPLLIANKLSASQRFADAQRWYHAIFNPLEPIEGENETDSSKYWRVRPFYETALAGEQNLLHAMLGIGVDEDEQEAAVIAFNEQIEAWLANPFDPHAVARLRPGAYMRATFMKYLDNLIAWADQLFRRDSIESITEATILYRLAADLLGPRPQQLPAQQSEPKSYSDLAAGLDAFSNAAIALENWVYSSPGGANLLIGDIEPAGWKKVPLRFWYFCYPPNSKLLEYWDIVEDRLWKIRHCQNIDGITRQLALFQPPIDPALLVAAAAAGLDISSVLGELRAGLPPYRFRYVYAKALDFCAELRGLGSALLSAFEKRDAEKLARIRSGHERALLDMSREIRVKQIEEIEARVEALEQSAEAIVARQTYYDDLFDENVSQGEKDQQQYLTYAFGTTLASQGIQALASFLGLIPEFEVGVPPKFSSRYGGSNISSGVRGLAEIASAGSTALNFLAAKAGTDAQHLRRRNEWEFQSDQAKLDKKRIDKEIIAAQIQLAIAKRELSNHDLRVKQAREVDEYLRDKYTNTELYDWMAGEIKEVYFQAYELAFDLAKRAEAAYRHELAIEASEARIVQFGYWNSVYDGLLAGERLSKDLRRLEKAYMDRDVREYELRKNISLAQLNPAALWALREDGTCTFTIPEVLFDLDHPGHVLRRIRSVSVTIPAVVGPYTSLGARLKLNSHKIRRSPADDLVSVYGGQDMIATSTAVSDAGLFQLDFRDERYLPFEYAGAADSNWTLDLPDAVRQFDYRTISDVVITLAYTARDGGDYRGQVEGDLVTNFNAAFAPNATQVIAVHDAFPNEWEAFLSPAASDPEQTLSLPLTTGHFPHFVQRAGFGIDSVELVLLLAEGTAASGDLSTTFEGAGLTLMQDGNVMTATHSFASAEQPGTWALVRTKGASPSGIVLDHWLNRDLVVGMLMLVNYSLT